MYVYGLHGTASTPKLSFKITGVRTYDKQRLPYQQIFDQKSVGRLAIVTCGGPFDASTGNYRDNIVAFAVPATSKPSRARPRLSRAAHHEPGEHPRLVEHRLVGRVHAPVRAEHQEPVE